MTATQSGVRENMDPGTVGVWPFRRILLAVLTGLALLVCFAGRLVFIQGWLRPVRISGGSMAETLVGQHLTLCCSSCGFPCRADANAPPEDGRIVCANCGQENLDIGVAATCPGDRVLLDRLAYRWRSPRRWELVAFRTAGDNDFFAVKRVVGLPGETVSIRRGDIYIDGQIQRKTLGQLREVAIPVHDTDYQPAPNEELPARWRSPSSSSRWSRRESALDCLSEPILAAQPDCLIYHHWRCMKGPWPRTDEYAILDNYGYNQNISRQLHRTSDLLLVCQSQISTSCGTLIFRAHDGYAWFDISLSMDTRETRVVCDQRCLASGALPQVAYARGVEIEVAVCDRQVLLAVEGRLVLRVPYQVGDRPFNPTASPLQIGAAGIGVTIQRLQVFRDIHYLDPRGLGQQWTSPNRLGPESIFVIGDNVPISRDSRHWEQGGVSRDKLLGRVLRGW